MHRERVRIRTKNLLLTVFVNVTHIPYHEGSAFDKHQIIQCPLLESIDFFSRRARCHAD